MKKSLWIFAFEFFCISCGSYQTMKPAFSFQESTQKTVLVSEEGQTEKQAELEAPSENIQIKEQMEIIPQKLEVQTRDANYLKERKILFRSVFYPFFPEKANIPFSLKLQLESIVPKLQLILKKQPKAVFVVKGYASSQGAKRFNLKLSLWRAQEVARYLSWKSGFPLSRFRIHGKGILSKQASLARRVEVLVIRGK